MRTKTLFAAALALALAISASAQDWKPLFSADDFSGWEKKSGAWSLSEGVLIGQPSTEEDAILLGSEEYGDFELQFQYRLTSWVFGGVLFRLNVQDKNLYGYQMDLSQTIAPQDSPMRQNLPGLASVYRFGGAQLGPQSRRTILFNDGGKPGMGPEMNEWHSASIRAVSGSLEIAINGEVYSKGVDEEFLAGRLGFGVMRGLGGTIEFKDVRIRALESEEDYVTLFNGKDLNGWKIHGEKQQWKVDDGIILSESIDGAYSYLATDKEYKDFSIVAEFQGLANGNSGLFFHSHLDGTNISGIQAEVQPPTGERLGHSGCLYDASGRGWIVDPATLTGEQEGAFRMNEWNTIRVDVKDHHIKTWLNGLRVVDFKDDKPKHDSGVIALQIHSGGGVKVNWRNIRIKEL